MRIVNMYDQSTCRLCMSIEGQMEGIFSSTDMVQKIQECTTIEVKNTKGLPTCICEICKSEIIIWSKFKKQCLKTEDLLKSKFPDLFKDEIPDDLFKDETPEDLFKDEIVEDISSDTGSITDAAEDNDEVENVEYIEDIELQFNTCNENYEQNVQNEQSEPEDTQGAKQENDTEEESSQGDQDIEVLDVNFEALEDDEELAKEISDCENFEIIQLIADGDGEKTESKKVLKSASAVSEDKIKKLGQKANSKSREVWKTSDGTRIRYHTKCKICGKLQQNIKQHMLIHTDEMPFQCPYCKRGFRQRSNFKHHVYIHTGEKPYKCKLCEKAFSDPASLRSHMIQHTGERRYSCDICSKAFGHSHTLAAHKRIHTQDRRHFCEYCTKKFLSKHALKKHIRTHTGERPYQCEQCPKNFSTSGNLATHKRVHTKERPYQCQFCGLDFAYKCVLNTHMKRHKNKSASRDDDVEEDEAEQVVYRIEINANYD